MRVLGVPVRVQASFFVVTLLLGFAPQRLELTALWLAVSFVCVLVHELGHALTARAFGQIVHIELHGWGGTAHFAPASGGRALTTMQRSAVLLAGPGAGFVLGGIAVVVPEPGAGLAAVALHDVVWITLGYGVLNLVPIRPLDGGQLVHTLLAAKLGPRADRASLVVDVVAAVAVVSGALFFGSPRLAFLGAWLALSRFRSAGDLVAALRDERDPDFRAFTAAAERHDDDAVIAAGERALPKLRGVKNRAHVAHRIAFAHERAGRLDDAGKALARMPAGWTPDAWLQARVHVSGGRFAEAIPLLRPIATLAAQRLLVQCLTSTGAHDDAVALASSLAVEPGAQHADLHVLEAALFFAGRYEDALACSLRIHGAAQCSRSAYNAACSCARLGRVDDGALWFARAVDDGFRGAPETDPDLDALRGDPRFVDALARCRASSEKETPLLSGASS